MNKVGQINIYQLEDLFQLSYASANEDGSWNPFEKMSYEQLETLIEATQIPDPKDNNININGEIPTGIKNLSISASNVKGSLLIKSRKRRLYFHSEYHEQESYLGVIPTLLIDFNLRKHELELKVRIHNKGNNYPCPLPNIYKDHRLCQGNFKREIPTTFLEIEKYIHDVFFQTEFTHSNNETSSTRMFQLLSDFNKNKDYKIFNI